MKCSLSLGCDLSVRSIVRYQIRMKTTATRILFAFVLSIAASVSYAGDKITVVELYTSQGCSSCPPADNLLGKLAGRDDIVALSLHVDYWDYIGWKDPFASPDNTTRQRQYAGKLGMGYVYTPQMVVQGMSHTTGSDQRAVEKLINDTLGAKRLDVGVSHSTNGLQIDIPGGTFEDEEANVFVAAFDARHENDVTRGENSGRKLAHYNVVREMVQIGSWSGDAVSLKVTEDDIKMTGHDGCAILVQSVKTGRILGAAQIKLTPHS